MYKLNKETNQLQRTTWEWLHVGSHLSPFSLVQLGAPTIPLDFIMYIKQCYKNRLGPASRTSESAN